jgi:hypothetical protein
MPLSVEQAVPVEGRANERERGVFDKQVSTALNITARQGRTLVTPANITFTTAWQSSMGENTVWRVDAFAQARAEADINGIPASSPVYVSLGRRATFRRDANGSAVQVGATTTLYTETQAGIGDWDLQIVASGSEVLAQVRDNGDLVTDWKVAVEVTEVVKRP